MSKFAYVINGIANESESEAREHAVICGYGLSEVTKVELEPGERVIEGRIVTVLGHPDEPQLEYKVTWNMQEIPFWHNFEGAKACVIAINTNKLGNRAKLISFISEREVEL